MYINFNVYTKREFKDSNEPAVKAIVNNDSETNVVFYIKNFINYRLLIAVDMRLLEQWDMKFACRHTSQQDFLKAALCSMVSFM